MKVKMVICEAFDVWFSCWHHQPLLPQPKPILVDKQSSEPNSPITKAFTEEQLEHQQARPPMHRGYSDLGNRMKKRVTLR